jgi:predicted MPP superfamily phosphohydrolase
MLLFFVIVSFILIIFFGGIGAVISIVYSPTSGIEPIYPISAIIFAFLLLAGQFIAHANHSKPMLPIYLASSLGLAVFFYMFLMSFILLLIIATLKIIGYDFNEFPFAELTRILIPVLLTTALLYGSVNARFLRKRHLKIPVLKAKGRNIRIALISDLHLGLLVGSARLNAILRTLKKERPDIIVSAGDLLDTNPRHLSRFEPFMRDMVSIAPVYAVMGNHEYYNGMEDSIAWLNDLGVMVLDDRCTMDGGTELSLIGVNDPSAFKNSNSYFHRIMDLVSSCEGSTARVLINHQPLFFRKSAEKGIDLQLSGHTHAGQIWPFGYTTRAVFREGDRGLQKFGGSYMYVCTGTGTWGPPMRIGTSSEIVIMDLIEKKNG